MFPQELISRPQWVLVRVIITPGEPKDVMPYNPRNLWKASPVDSRTWGTYEEARAKLESLKDKDFYLGFMLDGLVGIDLDNTDDPTELANQTRIYNSVVSYTERSISGGVHIICHGSIPYSIKRNNVEIYGGKRLFIMTGDHIEGRPTEILDCNDVVNAIVEQAGAERAPALEHSEPEKVTDKVIYDSCLSYTNGDRFKELWNGQWNIHYPSQSEADYALINMLAFVSHNNEQTKRLFRTSALGQRKKAMREDYLDSMIGQIRAEQNPVIDFSKFTAPPIEKEAKHITTDFKFPDGLVGEIAQYILDTSAKPIPQVALSGGLGLVCGIAGRTYNISDTGLNLYLLCIAKTAIGKEGAKQGMRRLIHEVAKKLPAAAQFVGPSRYASGQALVKRLESTPCMVSPMGEFGGTLKNICHPRATSSDVMWRDLFLELFNQSGPTDVLGEMVYSDTGKNTAAILSPAFSIVADATAVSIFENLSETTIEIGLVPRFLLIECPDFRPYTNPDRGLPPTLQLVTRVEQLSLRCLSMGANNSRQPITMTPGAEEMLTLFDREIDDRINAQSDDIFRMLWSRSFIKAVRIAGAIAVGLDVDNPQVTESGATWALKLAREDAQSMTRRFSAGVGGGDPEQIKRLRTIIINTLKARKSPRKMKEKNVVSHGDIGPRAYAIACFKDDRLGAGNALDRALRALKNNGEIVEMSKQQTLEEFNFAGVCYFITKDFQSR